MAIVGFELWRCKRRQSRAKLGRCRDMLPQENLTFKNFLDRFWRNLGSNRDRYYHGYRDCVSSASIDAIKGRGMCAHFSQAIITKAQSDRSQ